MENLNYGHNFTVWQWGRTQIIQNQTVDVLFTNIFTVIFSAVTPCSLAGEYRHYGGTLRVEVCMVRNRTGYLGTFKEGDHLFLSTYIQAYNGTYSSSYKPQSCTWRQYAPALCHHPPSRLYGVTQVSAVHDSAVEVGQNTCALLHNIYSLAEVTSYCSGGGERNIPQVTGFVLHRQCCMCHCAVLAGTPTSPDATEVETGHHITATSSCPFCP